MKTTKGNSANTTIVQQSPPYSEISTIYIGNHYNTQRNILNMIEKAERNREHLRTHSISKKPELEKRKSHNFILDCCNSSRTHMPYYNSLKDKCLSTFFQKPIMKKQLVKMKFVRKFLKNKLRLIKGDRY